ncbi:MAG: hypothetical protein HY554_00425 [Elusimicrobia bacterium]|nr:hypothetical protein [Elusimicrobiota bacterium]
MEEAGRAGAARGRDRRWELKPGDLLKHSLPGAVVAVYAALAVLSPRLLESLAQEDSWVEWLTFGFFAAAAAAQLAAAWRRPPAEAWAPAALAAFCLLVAGEELSWGQRLLGFVPPEAFLAGNVQQEANLHNLLQAALKPKWLVVAVLALWGTAAPLALHLAAGRLGRAQGPLRRLAPPEDLVPWSLLGAGLLVAYPVDFTGEYVELLTGCLFFLAAPGRAAASLPRAPLSVLPWLLAAAGWAAVESQARLGSASKNECAALETRALASRVAAGGATERLLDKEHLHKRAFSAVGAGYLRPEVLSVLESVACPGAAPAPLRRRYLVDPWGQPYWIRYQEDPEAGAQVATLYSFGPNRRRDSTDSGDAAGDDILARTSPLDEDGAGPGSGSEDDAVLR